MKTTLILVLLIAFATFADAGTKEDLAQIQRSVLDLQQQFWDLEKQMKDGSTSTESAVKNIQDIADTMRQSQAALNAKMDKVLDQLQALDQKLNETNDRIRDMSGPASRTTMPSNTIEPGDSNDQTGQQPAIRQPMQEGPNASIDEQQVYKEAMGLYTTGKFEQALRSFQDLLDRYPDSRLASDAQFMIGESFYGMKEYVDAVSEYDKVIKEYPDSDHVPGAKLKKAFSLFALGKKGQGVVELQQIVQRYPTTKEAQIAKQRLSELGLE
jgi:tol-pal system protein YbgF